MSRSLQFDIVANDKATGTLKGVQNAASTFAKSIGGMVTGLFALQNILSRTMQFGQEAFSWAGGLAEAAAGIGITTTELQQLQYAASQSGVEVGKLNKAFLDIRKTMRDAQGGNEQAVAVMQALGYTQEEIASGSVKAMDAFLKVSAAISAAKTEQEKFNIATALFGDKVAMDMIKVLGNFDQLKQQINETPLVSEEDIARIDKFSDRIDGLILRLKVLIATLGGNALDKPVDTFVKNLPGGIGRLLETIGITDITETPINKAVKDALFPPEAKSEAATPEAQAAAGALGKLGGPASAGKKAGGIAGGGGSEQFTALQQIGGAAGFRSGAGQSSPELTALEKIEENTRPGGTVPANGSTNFTNAGVSDAEYSSFVRVAQGARFSPRRRDRAPR